MMQIEEIVKKFDNNIKEAHNQISDTVQKITDTDERVCGMIQKFKNDIDSISISESNLFEKELSKLLAQYKDNCAKWCEAVNSMIEGKEFIDQFEKSVLIVVFGNVNVGKSTVGNIVAGTMDPDSKVNHKNDIEVLKKYFGEPPEFYEYDLAGDNSNKGAEKKSEAFFKEGYVETTANIQYFTRNLGMTWTDSPGICSVNWQNGDLAKKYVEFADLVIFVTTSSSPAKDDEIQELKKLFGKKKPVLILINKSDKWEMDEVDGEIIKCLIPKSDEDRRKQEDYVQNNLKNMASEILSETDAVSISSYLALQAFRENNAQKFIQSGFPRFYEKLGKIFEKNAVELKMNAPKQRINSMIDEIISGGMLGAQPVMGIIQYRELIMETRAHAEKIKDDIGKIVESAIPVILNESMKQITAAVYDNSYLVRKNGETVDLKSEINKIVTTTSASVLEEQLREVITDYNNKMASQVASYNKTSNIKLNAKKETVERYEYTVKEVRRDPEGLIEHVQSWVLKKEFTRSEVRKRRITDTFINGDNSAEVLEDIRHEINATIKLYVIEFIQTVQNQYFSQEEKFIGKILEMLDTLEKKLKSEKLEYVI